MKSTFRAERIVLCPFCGDRVDTAAAHASLTLKRTDGVLVHWRIHEQCFVDRITEEAATYR
ncbi:MAG TPA: hypothetical protein VFY85_12210 [Gemmatimonadaceae bacterium]|nr:hypothetical protein [Gemmatimonadaceae bacterium]